MSNTTNPQIVHESEASRQFVRISMPARVEINGQEYHVKDLSSGGIGIEGMETAIKKGEVIRMTLILPFPEFSLDLHLEAQVQSYNKKEKILGARFTDLTPPQISMLNHILRAYMSGDVVSSGDVLDVAGRSDFVRVRKQKTEEGEEESVLNLKRGILPMILIAVLGFSAFFIIAKNIYNGYFLVSASTGVVVSETLTVRAAENGVYNNALKADAFQTEAGEIIATALIGSSQAAINSPCKCFVTKRYTYNGEFLLQGAPLFDLVPVTSAPYITIFMNPAEASRLQINDRATMRIVGTDIEVSGEITKIEFLDTASAQGIAGTVQTKITVRPSQKLPIDLTGRPVTTEFSTI